MKIGIKGKPKEGKIKIGIEGKPEDIKNILTDFGSGATGIIKKRGFIKGLIISASLFIVISLILWIKISLPHGIYCLLIIIGLLLIFWTTSSVHLIFGDKYVSTLCLIFLLFIFSISLGLLGLNEAAKAFWDRIFQKKVL